MTEHEQQPVLRILNPDATPEQIAAILTVLAALASTNSTAPGPRPITPWSSPAHRLRLTTTPAPGAWRTSALPR
jgi:hypothetical protein